MSKTKETPTKQSPELAELTLNGTVTLTAPTREELAAKFDALKAESEGIALMAGAVGRSRDDGTYNLQVDII